jgi:hypothetical protein
MSNVDTTHPDCGPNGAAAVTGGTAFTHSWYGTVRSVFSKTGRAPLVDIPEPMAISHPSQPMTTLIGTIASLRFTSPAKLRALAEVTGRESIAKGDTLTLQGVDQDEVYFIVDGTFEVLISHFGHSPDFIRELGSGDSFGELGVLYHVPRTATVRCTSPGHILRIPGQAFLDAIDTGA